jgi:hypothetical protein
MNERIRELAEQAGLLGPSSRIGNSHDAAAEFAKLIIEECELAFWSEACRVSDLAYEEYCSNCKKIKERFRVA